MLSAQGAPYSTSRIVSLPFCELHACHNGGARARSLGKGLMSREPLMRKLDWDPGNLP